jgi:hypothetical protein
MKKLVSVAALLVIISASIFASPVSTEVITGQKEIVNEVDLFADVQTTASTRQEDLSVIQQNNERKISGDAGYNFGSEIKNGAKIAFGVLLYNKGFWNIRSHTGVSAYTLPIDEVSTSILNMTEKITLTSMNDIGIGKPYTYFDGGVCFYANQSKEELFSTSLGYIFGMGTGIEIDVAEKMAWYSEFGIVYHFMEDTHFSTVFTTGFRFYY